MSTSCRAIVDFEPRTDPTAPHLCSDNKMNAGIAIFTLLASQLIGYGMAGMLTDLTVKPSQSIFPSRVSNMLWVKQKGSRHTDNEFSSIQISLANSAFAHTCSAYERASLIVPQFRFSRSFPSLALRWWSRNQANQVLLGGICVHVCL